MQVIDEFDVKGTPVTVAVSADSTSVRNTEKAIGDTLLQLRSLA